MKRLFEASLVGFALALTGCQSEPEETPDITEAIPLNTDKEAASDASVNGADNDVTAGEGTSDTGEGSSSGQGSAVDAMPDTMSDTMETGSNPPGMTEPPKGSKVQRFN